MTRKLFGSVSETLTSREKQEIRKPFTAVPEALTCGEEPVLITAALQASFGLFVAAAFGIFE